MRGQGRFAVAAALLIAAVFAIELFPYSPPVRPRRDLQTFPLQVAGWSGSDEPMEDDVRANLGVDSYVFRTYRKPGGLPVNFYVGYFDRQVTGDLIHSPRHCYPGSGWTVEQSGRIELDLPGGPVTANRYYLTKGQDRQLVIYWYLAGRTAYASEYLGKFHLIWGALTQNRTDGALVRCSAPVLSNPEETQKAELEFIGRAYPLLLDKYLPE
jgi:EpsI family protein